jgi:hypothetical protein
MAVGFQLCRPRPYFPCSGNLALRRRACPDRRPPSRQRVRCLPGGSRGVFDAIGGGAAAAACACPATAVAFDLAFLANRAARVRSFLSEQAGEGGKTAAAAPAPLPPPAAVPSDGRRRCRTSRRGQGCRAQAGGRGQAARPVPGHCDIRRRSQLFGTPAEVAVPLRRGRYPLAVPAGRGSTAVFGGPGDHPRAALQGRGRRTAANAGRAEGSPARVRPSTRTAVGARVRVERRSSSRTAVAERRVTAVVTQSAVATCRAGE